MSKDLLQQIVMQVGQQRCGFSIGMICFPQATPYSLKWPGKNGVAVTCLHFTKRIEGMVALRVHIHMPPTHYYHQRHLPPPTQTPTLPPPHPQRRGQL